jgi:hypothetical protein
MIIPIKCVLFEDNSFFMKMALDGAHTLYLILFSYFVDMETLFGLNGVMPL